jgi:predicted nucleic acid-binding protein
MVQDPGPRIVVPDRVAREIAKPRTGLAAWLSKHPGVVSRFATAQESSLYLSLMQQATPKVDDGEAAAIALCRERRLLLVTEDKAARRKAEEHNVAWVNAEEFLEEWPLPR